MTCLLAFMVGVADTVIQVWRSTWVWSWVLTYMTGEGGYKVLVMLVDFYGRCGRHSNTGVEEYMGLVMGGDLRDR